MRRGPQLLVLLLLLPILLLLAGVGHAAYSETLSARRTGGPGAGDETLVEVSFTFDDEPLAGGEC